MRITISRNHVDVDTSNMEVFEVFFTPSCPAKGIIRVQREGKTIPVSIHKVNKLLEKFADIIVESYD